MRLQVSGGYGQPPGAPVISGTVQVESTLTATGGSGPIQWQYLNPATDVWTNISGATSSTYVIDGLYGSRPLRVTRGGVASVQTATVNPQTKWTKTIETGSNGDSLDPTVSPFLTEFDDVNEDGAPNAYSRVSTVQARFGTRSALQHSDGSGTGVGSRVYTWTDLSGAGLPGNLGVRQCWFSWWVYWPSVVELSVGAGDWSNVAQSQSYNYLHVLDPIWMIGHVPGLTGQMRHRLIWWPSNHFERDTGVIHSPRIGDPASGGINFDSSVNIPTGQWLFMEWMIQHNTWVNSTTPDYNGKIRVYMNHDELTDLRVDDCITKYGDGFGGGSNSGWVFFGKESYGQTISTPIDQYVDNICFSYGRQPYYLDQ